MQHVLAAGVCRSAFSFWLPVVCHACCTAYSSAAWVLCLHPFYFSFVGLFKKEKKRYARLLLPRCSLYYFFLQKQPFAVLPGDGKIATHYCVENWITTTFRNAFNQQHTKNGIYMFLFVNLCELTERTDLRGEDVPALGSGGAAAPAVQVGRGCRQKGVQTRKAALPLSS